MMVEMITGMMEDEDEYEDEEDEENDENEEEEDEDALAMQSRSLGEVFEQRLRRKNSSVH